MNEEYRSSGLLILIREIKDKVITESGIIVPDHDRSSIPLRGEVIASPAKMMKEGILPGDTLLYAAQTREKMSIKFQPLLGEKDIVAVPPECIMCYIPADAETRRKAIEKLKSYFEQDLLDLLSSLGNTEDMHVHNEWKY